MGGSQGRENAGKLSAGHGTLRRLGGGSSLLFVVAHRSAQREMKFESVPIWRGELECERNDFHRSAELANRSRAQRRLRMGRVPRGQLSLIKPPSTSTQQRNEVFKVPPYTKNSSSKPKQSQERNRFCRRSRRSRPDCSPPHRIDPRSPHWYLDFANDEPSRPKIGRYVARFVLEGPSEQRFAKQTLAPTQKTNYVFPDVTKATSQRPPAVQVPSKATHPDHVPRNQPRIFGLAP